jgi:hypothetical protein
VQLECNISAVATNDGAELLSMLQQNKYECRYCFAPFIFK